MAKWTSVFMITLFSLSIYGPVSGQQPAADREDAANDTGSDKETSADAQGAQNANEGKAESSKDTSASNRSDAAADTAITTAEAASNTPPVEQTTTSGSGSPAVLSGEDGDGRDGTNNVQRASMNMAGAPAANLNLSDDETVDPDSEMADRTQEQTASGRKQVLKPGVPGSDNDPRRLNDRDAKSNKGIKPSDKEPGKQNTTLKNKRG